MKKILNVFLFTNLTAALAMPAFSQTPEASAQNIQWDENSPYAPHAQRQKPVWRGTTSTKESYGKEVTPQATTSTTTASSSTYKAQEENTVPSKGLFYLGGAAYIPRLSGSKYERDDKFYDRNLGGVVLGAGTIFSEHHYLRLDTGIFFGSYTLQTFPGSYINYEYKSDLLIVPLHLTYNCLLYFDDAKRFRFRFGPSVGLTIINNHETEYASSRLASYASEVRKTRAAFSGGGELGFGFHFSKNVFIDLSYRLSFFSTDMINKSIITGTDQIDSGEKYNFLSHQIALSVGIRF